MFCFLSFVLSCAVTDAEHLGFGAGVGVTEVKLLGKEEVEEKKLMTLDEVDKLFLPLIRLRVCCCCYIYSYSYSSFSPLLSCLLALFLVASWLSCAQCSSRFACVDMLTDVLLVGLRSVIPARSSTRGLPN